MCMRQETMTALRRPMPRKAKVSAVALALVALAVMLSGCITIPPINPPDVPPPLPTPKEQSAAFLLDKAGTRCMNVLGMTEPGFMALVQRVKGMGGINTWYVYLGNDGDGLPPRQLPGAIYGGPADPATVAEWRKRLTHLRANGFYIVGWVTADDSRSIHTASRDAHLRHIDTCVSEFGDLIDEWVWGLEADSDGRKGHAKACIAYGKAKDGKRWGIHLNPGKYSDALSWGADVLYYQRKGFSPSKDMAPDTLRSEVHSVCGKVGGLPVVASEYHGSSNSANARACGQAVMREPRPANLVGTGNGR